MASSARRVTFKDAEQPDHAPGKPSLRAAVDAVIAASRLSGARKERQVSTLGARECEAPSEGRRLPLKPALKTAAKAVIAANRLVAATTALDVRASRDDQAELGESGEDEPGTTGNPMHALDAAEASQASHPSASAKALRKVSNAVMANERLGRGQSNRSRRSTSMSFNKRHAITLSRKVQVLLITATMAFLEVEDRNLLAVLSASSALICTCGVYVFAGGGALGAVCAAIVFVFACVALWVLRATSKVIEEMDQHGDKFETARRSTLDRFKGGALGPEPFSVGAELLRQPDEAATVDSLIARAEELEEGFRTELLVVVAGPQNEALGPNIKTAARAAEKVRMDYDNDARQLKDALRCSVVCETMITLSQCFARLRGLEDQGIVKILQVRRHARETARNCL